MESVWPWCESYLIFLMKYFHLISSNIGAYLYSKSLNYMPKRNLRSLSQTWKKCVYWSQFRLHFLKMVLEVVKAELRSCSAQLPLHHLAREILLSFQFDKSGWLPDEMEEVTKIVNFLHFVAVNHSFLGDELFGRCNIEILV